MFNYFFDSELRRKNKTRRWLANELQVNELTLNTKFNRNRFSLEDSFNIIEILEISADTLHLVYKEQINWHKELNSFMDEAVPIGFSVIHICRNCNIIFEDGGHLIEEFNERCFCPNECSNDFVLVMGMTKDEVFEFSNEYFGNGNDIFMEYNADKQIVKLI